MAKRLIDKQGEDYNPDLGTYCIIPTKHYDLRIRATFAFLVFIETAWNLFHKKKDKKDYEPIINLVIKSSRHDKFLIPAQELGFLLGTITAHWFKQPELEIDMDDYPETCNAFLYLCSVLQGGGQAGKKYLALRAMWVHQMLSKKTPALKNPNRLMSTSAFTLQ